MAENFLKEDAAIFLQDFGRDVTVVTVSTGATRPIKAIVDYVAATYGRDGKRLEGQNVIEVINDAVTGIPSTADLGDTRVRMPERPGSSKMQDWTLARSEDQDGWADEGMVRFILR